MKTTFLKTISFCVILFLTKNGYTQQLPFPDNVGFQDTIPQRDSISFETPDTSTVFYFYDHDFTHFSITDTLEHIQRYDPVFLQEYGYYSLGDFGSAHRQSVYQPRTREGIDLGFYHYDLYLHKRRNMRFFNTSHLYSQIKYTAGGTQEEGYVNAVFAQNINDNFSAAIDFSRIIHRGGYEKQQHQAAKQRRYSRRHFTHGRYL